jgi:hypothetical protein
LFNTNSEIFQLHHGENKLIFKLAIPIPASRNAIDQLLESDEQAVDKQRRLAQLLMLQNPPKRTALIKDLVSCGNFSPFMLTPETTGAT